MIQPQEIRIGNYLYYKVFPHAPESYKIIEVTSISKNGFISFINDDGKEETYYLDNFEKIPLTEENFLKYIDWDFEEGFNIKRQYNGFWDETCYLMENIIDGSGDFKVCFSKPKVMNDFEVSYWIDNERLEFMLSDTLHNFQNLFFISTGQDLPIKK